MGDTVQFTTYSRHKNIFFEVNSHALYFEIKAQGHAGISLSNKIGGNDFEVAIGQNRITTFIREVARDAIAVVETRNIISVNHFSKFWLTWNSNAIRLGNAGDSTPIISSICNMRNLKYISFVTLDDERTPVHWRVELPPKIKRPSLKPITGGELYWTLVNSETQSPDDAFIGGFENENLYIIRASHRGSMTPGKFVSSEGLGYVSWGGEANVKDSFDVLCGFNCTWVPTTLDRIPVGAVIGGHSENMHHEKLFIGRARHMGNLIVGKVQPSHRVCYIPYDGKEVAKEEYEILVVPGMDRSVVTFQPRVRNDTENDEDEESESNVEMEDDELYED